MTLRDHHQRAQLFQLKNFRLALLCSLLSCGAPLKGLDDQLTPLLTVEVAIEQSDLDFIDEETRSRLRAGIIWVGINIPSEWCAGHLTSALRGQAPLPPSEGADPSEAAPPSLDFETLQTLLTLCPDPLGVTPLLVGPSASLSEGRSEGDQLHVTLPLTALPPSEVLVGTPDARVGYAALVVFDDLDQDGVFDIGFDHPPLGMWRGRGDDDRDEEMNDEREGEGRYAPKTPDELYSASFTSLMSDHTRLVFREGDFIESYYYPLGGCVPPQGLSVIDVKGTFQSAECEAHSATSPTLLKLSPPNSRRQELACETSPISLFPPTEEAPNTRFTQTCISPTELVLTDPEAGCKALSVLSLVECPSFDNECSNPEWDDRDSPPEWWPCEGQR